MTDPVGAERRRIGVVAAKAFVTHFIRRQAVRDETGGRGPEYWEEWGRTSAYRHIVLTCGLTQADGDVPDDDVVRELLELPELARLRQQRQVHDFFHGPDPWDRENV